MAARILVVEDDPTIHRHLSRALANEGHDVRGVATGHDAIAVAVEVQPELVLLDLGLPDLDGIDVCRSIRRGAPEATIVVLTARRAEIDVIVGLDAGADDYLTKPFRLAELMARVRAHLRRSGENDVARIDVDGLAIDVAARRVRVDGDGDEIVLRAKEFDLLVRLAVAAGNVVTREQLMSDVWDEHWFGSTKTLDMHISSLRRRLGPIGARIVTIRGVGYRLER